MEKVWRVEAAQGEQRSGESWRVINEMSGRKRSKEGQVTGLQPRGQSDHLVHPLP
jgi:hypothetical protein